MELRGNLRDFTLPDIIQLVAFGRKTGALWVESPLGGTALYFEEGSVVHAEYPGAEGVEAAYALLQVPAGEFRFQTEIRPPKRTLAMDPTNLVMEAARLLDESRRDAAGDNGADACEGDGSGDSWLAPQEPIWDGVSVKRQIRELLLRRFGAGAKRVLQAVDQSGDTEEDLLGLAAKVEKYVQVFLDAGTSELVGREIRSLIQDASS